MRPLGRGLLSSAKCARGRESAGWHSEQEWWTRARVGRSSSVARVGRYSLSDNGEGAQQRAARQRGSEGQVELVPGRESTGGRQEQERWARVGGRGSRGRVSRSHQCAGASAGRISAQGVSRSIRHNIFDFCPATEAWTLTPKLNRGSGRFVEESQATTMHTGLLPYYTHYTVYRRPYCLHSPISAQPCAPTACAPRCQTGASLKRPGLLRGRPVRPAIRAAGAAEAALAA